MTSWTLSVYISNFQCAQSKTYPCHHLSWWESLPWIHFIPRLHGFTALRALGHVMAAMAQLPLGKRSAADKPNHCSHWQRHVLPLAVSVRVPNSCGLGGHTAKSDQWSVHTPHPTYRGAILLRATLHSLRGSGVLAPREEMHWGYRLVHQYVAHLYSPTN